MSTAADDGAGARTRAYHVGNVKTALVDAARALLREGGMAGLDLRTLSARAGVALGTVYHHFESKTDLLAALAEQGFSDLTARLVAAAETAEPGRVIRECVLTHSAFAAAEPDLYALMFDSQIARLEPIRAARRQAQDALEATIAALPQAEGRTPEGLHAAAVAVWTCAHGAASLALLHEEDGDLADTMIRGLTELYLGGREN
jgi:AcrR family transcriptional regulator